MAETKKNKKTKKVAISEEDIALLLQRYSATTIITLLQEVDQFSNSHVKIDWSEVVKKTSTGITNAREYQMLWRHLAYRHTLLETVDQVTEPLDDDSDLESYLEVFPPVSAKASVEAAAFSKVLLGSSLPSPSGPLDLLAVEAPLTINIPTGQASTTALDYPWPACTQSKNITVPVSIQRKDTSRKKHNKGFPPLLSTTVPSKEELESERGESAAGAQRRKEQQGSLPTVPPTKGLKRGGSTAVLPTQKRRPWKPDEDMELIAAVQRYGEGNWATILKGDFKADRTGSQLSQRWAILRKQQANNLNSGGHGNPVNSQLTAEQLATRRAIVHALDMPMMDNILGVTQTQSSIPLSSAAVPCGREDTSAGCRTQQTSMPTTTLKFNSVEGPSVPLKPISGSDLMIEAAAVAAGACIATPSTAAQLLKCPTQTQPSCPLSSAAVPCGREDTSAGCQTQQVSKGMQTTALKFNSVKGPLKPLSGSDPMIQAAAIAAGARIATPSAAASLFKAAQSKNAVHISTGEPCPKVRYIKKGLPPLPPPPPPPPFSSSSSSIPHFGNSQLEHGKSTR